jgi:hypothetical protein
MKIIMNFMPPGHPFDLPLVPGDLDPEDED